MTQPILLVHQRGVNGYQEGTFVLSEGNTVDVIGAGEVSGRSGVVQDEGDVGPLAVSGHLNDGIGDVPARGYNVVVVLRIQCVDQGVNSLRVVVAELNQSDIVAVLFAGSLRSAPAHVTKAEVANVRAVVKNRFRFFSGGFAAKSNEAQAHNQRQGQGQ